MAFEPTALGTKPLEKKEPIIEVGEKTEAGMENRPEAGEVVTEAAESVAAPEATPQVTPSVTAPVAQVTEEKDPELTKIENILSEDLTEIFLTLPEDKRQAFKIKGEEVAKGIKAIIDSGKIKLMKILDLIRGWLKMIPGVNKFFLDQEAKIKVDKLMGEFEKKPSSQNEIL